MSIRRTKVLSINAGSSSIKFALFETEGALTPVFAGGVNGIGSRHSSIDCAGPAACVNIRRHFPIPDHVTAVQVLVEWLVERIDPDELRAIGHRVVYGGPDYWQTQPVDAHMRTTLAGLAPFAHEHMPQELHLIHALELRFAAARHIACFDSAFHRAMPLVAQTVAIPRRYQALGVRRYGFHGLSCAYLMEELGRQAGPEAGAGRVVIAHLGGGASVTAVLNGKSIDTSMGLTPGGGVAMGTRAGDIDPGLAWYLCKTEQMSAGKFNHMLNHESGMLGISETSGDMGVLLSCQGSDGRAAEAVELFCYQVRKMICAMAGALQGIDTLVFSGGIGENSAEVRARICAGLGFLGIELDGADNAANAAQIASRPGAVAVRLIHTDEQLMIAQEVQRHLGQGAE